MSSWRESDFRERDRPNPRRWIGRGIGVWAFVSLLLLLNEQRRDGIRCDQDCYGTFRTYEGTYGALEGGMTAGPGQSGIDMRNDKGVVISARTTSSGLKLTFAPTGALSSSGGTLLGIGGGGALSRLSSTHLPRTTGEVRSVCELTISTAPLPSSPRRASSVNVMRRKWLP